VVQMPTGYIADGTECFVCKSMGVTPCELQRPTDSNQCILQIFGVNLANLAIVGMSKELFGAVGRYIRWWVPLANEAIRKNIYFGPKTKFAILKLHLTILTR